MIISSADTAIIISALIAQTLKEMGIPFPGVTQAALMYAGWQLATTQYLTGAAIIAVILLGGMAGALTAYVLARHLGLSLVKSFPKYLNMTPEKLEKIKIKLSGKTLPAILFFRLVIPLKVSLSITAGLMRIQLGKFIPGILIALVVWEALYVTLGAIGKQAFKITHLPWDIGLVPSILVAIALGLLIRFGVVWGLRRWEERKSEILNPKSEMPIPSPISCGTGRSCGIREKLNSKLKSDHK